MRRCEDEKMWRCEDVKMRRCEDEKMWRCEDVNVWRWWENVKMRRCEDEKMWRWETDPHYWKNPALRRSREKIGEEAGNRWSLRKVNPLGLLRDWKTGYGFLCEFDPRVYSAPVTADERWLLTQLPEKMWIAIHHPPLRIGRHIFYMHES